MIRACLTVRRTTVMGLLIAGFITGYLADGATGGGQSAHRRFCEVPVARDYLEQFARLKPIRGIPNAGKLPFAPKGLTLEVRGGKLVVKSGLIGFGFRDHAAGQLRRLAWDVSAELFKVEIRGNVVRRLDSLERRIGSVKGNRIKDLLFRVEGRPSYYRVDISFTRSESSRHLGKFSRYVRLVRPRFDARVLALKSRVIGGTPQFVRLANYGSESIFSASPDWRLTVERLEGEGWVVAPSNPPSEKRQPIIKKLGPGEIDRCIRFDVPAQEVPGRYRISMFVDRSLKRGDERRAQVMTEFEVSAATKE